MMLLATGNLSAVQANLGHRSQRVTERYAKAVAALRSGDADKTAKEIFRFAQDDGRSKDGGVFRKSQTKSQIEGEVVSVQEGMSMS
jgi:hypothetical protein